MRAIGTALVGAVESLEDMGLVFGRDARTIAPGPPPKGLRPFGNPEKRSQREIASIKQIVIIHFVLLHFIPVSGT